MKTQISRRRAIAGLVTSMAATVVTGALTSSSARHHKVQWIKLTNEPTGPGDMWASEDPNHLENQGKSLKPPLTFYYYNLQMQAVHSDYFGRPADKIGINNGAFWRPIGLVRC